MRKLLTPHVRAIGRPAGPAVYFPACINRIFGRDPDRARHPSLPQALVEVSARAGKPLWIPGDVAGKCCSTPWSSKGCLRGHEWMAATTCARPPAARTSRSSSCWRS
ncbi:MAG TPA: hypothetical protein VGY50_08120 [Streptosporangiaceae bacterium]|nr:hypothetical protein [Streptosporangiaceae bacterium]